MNAALCSEVGSGGAFPTPAEIVGCGADALRDRCSVGYRAKTICGLAQQVCTKDLQNKKQVQVALILQQPTAAMRMRESTIGLNGSGVGHMLNGVPVLFLLDIPQLAQGEGLLVIGTATLWHVPEDSSYRG